MGAPQYSLEEMQALQAATVNAAALLGQDGFGSIGSGKLADIVAVPGNPLEDIRATEAVSFVMKNGMVYEAP